MENKAFVACKVDEFHIPSPQTVGNLRESPLGQIWEYELICTQQLHFLPFAHNP